MAKELDITGKKFNRLTAIERVADDRNGNVVWKFLCDCGTVKIAMKSAVTGNNTHSCGCLNRENRLRRNIKHGMSGHPLYDTWSNMLSRCNNPKDKNYHNYGERGISVCESWSHNPENFYRDMGDRPRGMTIERIDNNKGYGPGNCRWATYAEQNSNTRSNINVTVGGQAMCLASVCRNYGVTRETLLYRVGRGMSLQEALAIPPMPKGKRFGPSMASSGSAK